MCHNIVGQHRTLPRGLQGLKDLLIFTYLKKKSTEKLTTKKGIGGLEIKKRIEDLKINSQPNYSKLILKMVHPILCKHNRDSAVKKSKSLLVVPLEKVLPVIPAPLCSMQAM